MNYDEIVTAIQTGHRASDLLRDVMVLLAACTKEHGRCQPRKERACTRCNAIDDLMRVAHQYKVDNGL